MAARWIKFKAFRPGVRALRWRPVPREKQKLLKFQERHEQRLRVFRLTIVVATLLAATGLSATFPWMSSGAPDLGRTIPWQALRLMGLHPPRAVVDAYWRERRQRREDTTRTDFATKFAALGPAQQAFLRAAGMGPEEAVIRWGNYDMTLVLSGKVFKRDDTGRQYRLRPGVVSAWFQQVSVLGMDVCQFLLPDTPEVRRLATSAGALRVPAVTHTTNSWGCRGPEPDMTAPFRLLVLGDSFMQGYLVDDRQTPTECLRRSASAELGANVSVLNMGTLGYCPEHYEAALRELVDHFSPQMVVLGLYANDFGEDDHVLSGHGDWDEEGYWLEEILRHCRSRAIDCLIAPVPCESQRAGPRKQGNYAGMVANLTGSTGRFFCDPTDILVDEDLKLRLDHGHRALLDYRSPLYNGHLSDGHLSPRGAELWGKVVAQRVTLLLKLKSAMSR
ncbi:MAG: SGNH/GDSL hydrolase family protein [Planctomycetaceae bacterium]|nr:SGNH/GDSL hydrolase family protein [Planctomycetaceae bacterium]